MKYNFFIQKNKVHKMLQYFIRLKFDTYKNQ